MGNFYSIPEKENTVPIIPMAPPLLDFYKDPRENIPLWAKIEFLNNKKTYINMKS